MDHINPFIRKRLKGDHLDIKPLSYYVDGIVQHKDYYILSESITMLESEIEEHQELALSILIKCYDEFRNTFRLGITGSPGVGKSTFIDSIVPAFVSEGHHVGILTIDPSSKDGKGSILGDKTRMEELVKDKSIFIRPSPSNRHLGGLNQYTFEAITLCEAAGIDRILIETVGIGQSETEVSDYTDATILLLLPGSGDGLQGIKKGVIEKADLIIIHKADGAIEKLADVATKEFKEALHYSTDREAVPIMKYSSISEKNKSDIIKAINKIILEKEAQLHLSRKKQNEEWFLSNLTHYLKNKVEKEIVDTGINTLVSYEMQKDSPYAVFAKIRNRLDIQLKLKE